MFYIIYKITNNLNGKYYIGKHQTKDLDDGYMGSGKFLKRAIKKHGLENFTKEILHVFQTEQEMNDKEKELVVLDEMSYNLCEGGKGGFGYINDNVCVGLTRIQHNRKISGFKKFSKEQRIIYSKMGGKARSKQIKNMTDEERKLVYIKNKGFAGKNHTKETRFLLSSKMQGKVPWNKGKTRTAEEKEKISKGVRKHLKESTTKESS